MTPSSIRGAINIKKDSAFQIGKCFFTFSVSCTSYPPKMDAYFIAYVQPFLVSRSWEDGRQIIEDACEGGTSRRFVEFVFALRKTKRRRQTFVHVAVNRHRIHVPR